MPVDSNGNVGGINKFWRGGIFGTPDELRFLNNSGSIGGFRQPCRTSLVLAVALRLRRFFARVFKVSTQIRH